MIIPSQRWDYKRILESVKDCKKCVVARNSDGTYRNIGLNSVAKMDGHSYLVTETTYEFIVDMASARKIG